MLEGESSDHNLITEGTTAFDDGGEMLWRIQGFLQGSWIITQAILVYAQNK